MSEKVIRYGRDSLSKHFSAVVSSADAIAAMRELVAAAKEYGKVHEEEQTKRAVIHAVQAMQTERLQRAESVLRRYFELTFAERATTTAAMFERLDTALEAGDAQAVHSVVRGVVDIAQASPLAGLEDFAKFWDQLGTPESPIEL